MANIHRFAQIGKAGETGVERIALSEEDKQARDVFRQQMEEAGLSVRIDELGNMMGVRKGKQDVPPVATGSHLDTVYQGGRFDGALGVLAGLEVIQSLNDAGIETEKPVAVINFTNEEGVRFAPDMMGGHAFAGLGSASEMLASPAYDDPELTVGEGLKKIGYNGSIPCGSIKLDSFLELHIEQGPVLELEEIQLGAVEKVQGIYWTRYSFKGQANHAGTTPIAYRKDAGYAASQVVHYVGDLARKSQDGLLSTVGSIAFEPNAINIVPERASFTLDLRCVNGSVLTQAQTQIDQFIEALARDSQLELHREEMVRFAPVEFAQDMVNLVEEEGKSLGLSLRRMPSGAGHDAQMIASICPTAMIFIPSVKGISHNVEELSYDQDLENGANVLLNAILKRANDA